MTNLNTETEFKFLVVNSTWRSFITHWEKIDQGYLNVNFAESMIRIRITDNKAELCIKYPTDKDHTRIEYEYEVPINHGRDMLHRAVRKVSKYRFFVNYDSYRFEIDQFTDNNTGLIVAEFETIDPMLINEYERGELFKDIPWIGKDVTHDKRYLNCNLALNPFNTWD